LSAEPRSRRRARPRRWRGTAGILAATGRYPFTYEVTIHFLDRDFARLRSDALADLGAVSYSSAVALADGTFALIAAGERGRFLIRYSPGGERLGAPQLIDGLEIARSLANDSAQTVQPAPRSRTR
jgi:hypothetical protein